MSLLFPAYLLGLLALAVPWILHRFSDQRPPEQLFPSKQFLESTTPPVSRKRTLRYRALLLLRVLSLLLLCLLFTQPWINRDNASSASQQHHMIVLDQSLSMRAQGRWDAALDMSDDLLQQLAGDSIELIGFDKQVRVLASNANSGNASQNNNEPDVGQNLQAVLNELQPGFVSADYGALMQRLDRLAAQRDLPVKVWLVSDMQASSLPAQLNALYAPHIASMQFMNVDTEDQLNVHLTANAQSGNGATMSVSVTLMASTNNESTAPIERTVQIVSSDDVLDSRVVSLVPGELSSFVVEELVLPAATNVELGVRLLEPDALSADNQQSLAISSGSTVGVVLLTASQVRGNSAPVFIATALEADSSVLVEAITGVLQQVPDDTSNLFTHQELSEELGLDVLQFVDSGNNSLIYNERQGRLPETPSSEVYEGQRIGFINEAHPLALGEINWIGARFYDVPAMDLQSDDEVLIRLSEGQPLLIERATARGRLLLLNDPLDAMASNLPLQPSFVALMQSILAYFDASTSVPDQIVVGERLSLPANVQLIDANGNSMVDLSAQSQTSSTELIEPGIYTAVNSRGERPIKAILDPAEANLAAIEPDALNAWNARYEDQSNPDNSANNTSEEPLRSSQSDLNIRELLNNNDPMRQTLWQWLLPVLGLLILFESWLANRRLNVRRDGS